MKKKRELQQHRQRYARSKMWIMLLMLTAKGATWHIYNYFLHRERERETVICVEGSINLNNKQLQH